MGLGSLLLKWELLNSYELVLFVQFKLLCKIFHWFKRLNLSMQLRFGENNMHGCEIMLKDLADSKRINTNIKAVAAAKLNQHGPTVPGTPSGPVTPPSDAGYSTPPATVGMIDSHPQATVIQSLGSQNDEIVSVDGDKKLPLDVLEATIISSLFWPPFQVVSLCLLHYWILKQSWWT